MSEIPTLSRTHPSGLIPRDLAGLRALRAELTGQWGEADPDAYDRSQEHRTAGRLIRSIDQAEARDERNRELDAETDPRKLAEGLPR